MDAGCPLGIGIGIARVNFNLAESRKHSIPFWQIFQHLVNGTGSLLSRCSWNLTRTIEANDARCPGKKRKEKERKRSGKRRVAAMRLNIDSWNCWNWNRGDFSTLLLYFYYRRRVVFRNFLEIFSRVDELKYELCRANIIQICGGKFVEILVWIRARSIVISNNDRESHWCDKWGFKFTKVCVSLTRGTRMKLWKITSRSRREPGVKGF